MDAELRDAERSAAGGDPIEAERLAGLRARTAAKRRGQTEDRAERERLNEIVRERRAAHEKAGLEHRMHAECVAEEVATWLARPAGERNRASSRAFLVSLSAKEVATRAALEAAWVSYAHATHGWHRATFGRCPADGPKHFHPSCNGDLGPDGWCTKCPDACGCDGCSGAL